MRGEKKGGGGVSGSGVEPQTVGAGEGEATAIELYLGCRWPRPCGGWGLNWI